MVLLAIYRVLSKHKQKYCKCFSMLIYNFCFDTRTFPQLNEHLYDVLRKRFKIAICGETKDFVLPWPNEIRDLFSNPQKAC